MPVFVKLESVQSCRSSLADRLAGDCSHILEETRARDVEEGQLSRVITSRGSVYARDIIVTTHFPILDRGQFFVRVHPKREYAVCGLTDPERDPQGMYVGVDPPLRSLRTAPSPDGLMLIVGGEQHRTGEGALGEEYFRRLEAFGARASAFSDSRIVGQRKITTPSSRTVQRAAATGIETRLRRRWLWSLGHDERHSGRNSPFRCHSWTSEPMGAFYNPNRVTLRASAGKMLSENLKVAQHFIGDRFSPEVMSPQKVAPGERALADIDGRKAAIYRDEQGKLHELLPYCTHMGCILSWNAGREDLGLPLPGLAL